MDVGDVDDVESDDDSAEDAEPNPTFESPAYTLARTVGYLNRKPPSRKFGYTQ